MTTPVEKKPSLLRKKFVLYVLLPLLVLCTVVYFCIDGWVEAGLEAAGEAAVGARVEIDGCKVSLFPIGLRWSRLQVTNPDDTWKNLFETKGVRFALDAGQLLRNKYIIETMEVHDLILGTRRTTDGALPKKPEQASTPSGPSFADQARQALEGSITQTPVFNLEYFKGGFKPDSLLKAVDLRTPRFVDSLKQQAVHASQQWQAVMTDVDQSKAKVAEVETNIKAINIQELKSVDKIAAAVTTVDRAIATINEVKNTVNNRRTTVEAEVKNVTGSLALVDDVVKADFDRVKGLAHLPELNTSGFARLLVGQEMYTRAMTWLHWVDFARTNIKKYTPAPAKADTPPRMKGQNIHFPVTRTYPKFWIKKVMVSGGTDSASYADIVRLRGEVTDMTNDQTATGQPMRMSLDGVVNQARAMSLRALFDRRKEEPYDEYQATLTGVPLASFQLGKPEFLDGKVTHATMNSGLRVLVPGKNVDATASLNIGGVTVEYAAQARNTAERLAREVLDGIHEFEVHLRLWNTSGPFDIALQTDLDDKIAARIRQVLGQEIARLQNELRAKFEAKIAEKRKELERIVAEKTAEVQKQLVSAQALVNEKLAIVEAKKKELTDRLEQEKKKGVNKLLDQILKKK